MLFVLQSEILWLAIEAVRMLNLKQVTKFLESRLAEVCSWSCADSLAPAATILQAASLNIHAKIVVIVNFISR